jgi:hypothetical protein
MADWIEPYSGKSGRKQWKAKKEQERKQDKKQSKMECEIVAEMDQRIGGSRQRYIGESWRWRIGMREVRGDAEGLLSSGDLSGSGPIVVVRRVRSDTDRSP